MLKTSFWKKEPIITLLLFIPSLHHWKQAKKNRWKQAKTNNQKRAKTKIPIKRKDKKYLRLNNCYHRSKIFCFLSKMFSILSFWMMLINYMNKFNMEPWICLNLCSKRPMKDFSSIKNISFKDLSNLSCFPRIDHALNASNPKETKKYYFKFSKK